MLIDEDGNDHYVRLHNSAVKSLRVDDIVEVEECSLNDDWRDFFILEKVC